MLRKFIALALFGVLILSAAGCKGPPEPVLPDADSESKIQLVVSETENPADSEETSALTEPEVTDSSEQQNISSPETPQTGSQSNFSSPSSVTSAPEKTSPPTVKPPSGNQTNTSESRPTVPTEPPRPNPESTKPKPTESPAESTSPPPDTEKEYKRIIRDTIAYAESYAVKGFTFVWDDSLKFGWETGYMGTPRVKYESVDGVIGILKHHIDLIVKTATAPGNGIPGYSASYKVVQVTVDGDVAFVVLYG